MRLYADQPVRRALQIAGDVFLVSWTIFWIWFATVVHRATAALAEPGAKLENAGEGMSTYFGEAGERAARIPLVGDDLRAPFEGASNAADALADAGRQGQEMILLLALLLALAVAVAPTSIAALIWVPLRVRFVRRATAAQHFLDSRADLDLFALRALARQPMHILARISDDPAGAWRRGDRDVVSALATAELRSAGLRMPPNLDLRASSQHEPGA